MRKLLSWTRLTMIGLSLSRIKETGGQNYTSLVRLQPQQHDTSLTSPSSSKSFRWKTRDCSISKTWTDTYSDKRKTWQHPRKCNSVQQSNGYCTNISTWLTCKLLQSPLACEKEIKSSLISITRKRKSRKWFNYRRNTRHPSRCTRCH